MNGTWVLRDLRDRLVPLPSQSNGPSRTSCGYDEGIRTPSSEHRRLPSKCPDKRGDLDLLPVTRTTTAPPPGLFSCG